MSELVLVKHSLPDIDPAAPAATWRLSAEGRRRARAMAEGLTGRQVAALYSSAEPKAVQTAAAIGRVLRLPTAIEADLGEQDRTDVEFLAADDFRTRVRHVFSEPEARVLGSESAAEALARYRACVHDILARREENVVVVSHGTVMTLLVASCNTIEPFELWDRLALPSFVVLRRPDLTFDGVVHR